MFPQCCIVDTRWWQLKYFLFSPLKLGKIPILTNIFQMGWFNHQLVIALTSPFLQTFAMLLLLPKQCLKCLFVRSKEVWSADSMVVTTYLQGRVHLNFCDHGHMVKTDPIEKTCETSFWYFSVCRFFKYTPWKFNKAPENGWLEDEFPFGIPYFQGLC